MKIYLDLQKQAITKTTDENIYQGDIYSNVFEVLFYNYTDSNWFPTMSQLAPNGRKAGEFTADALEVGESHEYTEDGVTYLKFDFTMGASWVLMKGRSEFYIWFNRLGGAIVQKKCVGVVNVMIDQSTTDYFIADPTFNPNVKAYIDACIAELGDGSPKYFDTASNIANCTEDKGLAVATDTGHLYYWDETKNSTTKYTDSGLVYNDLSAYYTITQMDALLAQKVNKADVADNLTTNDSDKVLSAKQGYILKGMLDALEAATYTKTEVNSALALKADKSTTYTKTETNALLDTKADKSTTYTKTEVDDALRQKADVDDVYSKSQVNNLLDGKVDKGDTYTRTVINNFIADLETRKANKSNTYTKEEIDTTINGIGEMFGLIESAIGKLESVQNVVDVVATKSALNSYDTSKLEENDKIQVIADETHNGASTIYNWSGSAWQYIGAYGTNSYTKPETLEQIDLHKLVNKTYSELATLKSTNGLVAGQLYRITDYVTTTNGKCNNVANDVRSMEHPFDIIVRAISNNKFSEEARAINHSGDSYFANSDLKAWRLWYCFENDSVRFEWADTSNGKGVIYRMIDEFENDVPYDFKNIQFKRYKITGTSDPRQANAVGSYYGFNGNYSCSSDSTDFIWCYTFSKRSDGSDLSLTQTLGGSWQNCYYTKEVIMAEYLTDNPNYRGCQALNNIVFICDNIIVDFQIGAGSHHNTIIGNKDLTYIYFKEMFRYNILYGEMSHTRADECFEQNMIGDFTDLSTDCTHWTRFAHHFGSNTAIHLTANDIKARVNNTKFPTTFFRCTISNIWDGVHARAHNTFSYCEFGYMSNVTLSGTGDWNAVRTIMNDHTTIKIAYLYGSTLGRMEYVSISEGAGNTYAIMNLTIGSIYGSSNKVLTIALSDLYSYELATSNEKKIDFAIDVPNDTRALYYTSKTITSSNILDGYNLKGTIQNDGSVVWSELDNLSTKFAEVNTYTDTKFNQAKSYTDNAINDLRWELGSHTLDVTSDTTTAYSKSVPNGAIGCQINKIGGMSYKSENLLVVDNTFSYSPYNETIYFDCVGGATYTLKSFGTYTGNFTLFYYDGSQWSTIESHALSGGYTITAPNNAKRIGCNGVTSNQVMAVKGSTAPTTWSEGFTGIRDSAVTSVVSKGSNDTTIATLTIPTAIQNITGYGWGINENCYNYIDFATKKFVQKVGRVDLGTLTFENLGNNDYVVSNIGIKPAENNGVVINAVCTTYNVVSYNTLASDTTTTQLSGYTSDRIYVRDTSGTLNGMLYFELATPIETDISAYLTTDTIDVEPNGTLEFTNTYNQDVPSDIDYLIEEVKA